MEVSFCRITLLKFKKIYNIKFILALLVRHPGFQAFEIRILYL